MKYLEIRIDTDINGLEIISNSLIGNGILQFQISDPRDVEDLMENKESYHWDYLDESVISLMEEEPHISVYIEEDIDAEKNIELIRDGVRTAMNLGACAKITIIEEDDSQWKDLWKKYTKTSKISDKIVVKPTWDNYEKKDGELIIEIDPGMAFGTGSHETTSMCVEMLDKYMKPNMRVIDVGCGSGILSIGAALLGAEEVIGIDIDEVAVSVARENIELNNVSHIAKAQYGDLMKGIDCKGNIIAANLMADLVMMLSKSAFDHLEDGGLYITSGILTEKRSVVEDAIKKAGFKIKEVVSKGQWCCIVGEKA